MASSATCPFTAVADGGGYFCCWWCWERPRFCGYGMQARATMPPMANLKSLSLPKPSGRPRKEAQVRRPHLHPIAHGVPHPPWSILPRKIRGPHLSQLLLSHKSLPGEKRVNREMPQALPGNELRRPPKHLIPCCCLPQRCRSKRGIPRRATTRRAGPYLPCHSLHNPRWDFWQPNMLPSCCCRAHCRLRRRAKAKAGLWKWVRRL